MTEDRTEGVGDGREKHVTVTTKSGKRTEHGDVYLRHADEAFLVSSDEMFSPEETTRYAKDKLLRVEITQHHSACFLTTATAGEGPELDTLRTFRDGTLTRTAVGRGLVRIYYGMSPSIAATLERHPDGRTTRTVRRLVEWCAGLARRRERTDEPTARLGLSVLLVLIYVIGLVMALVGHAGIRAIEVIRGDG